MRDLSVIAKDLEPEMTAEEYEAIASGEVPPNQKKKNKGHTVPAEYAFSRFCKHMGWTEATLQTLTDEYVYREQVFYELEAHFGLLSGS